MALRIIFILTFAHFAWAAEDLESWVIRNDFPSSLVKREEFRLPHRLKDTPIQALVYGHEEYGLFATANLSVAGGRARFEFIPPGYKYPTTFYAQIATAEGSKLEKLGERKYKSPLTHPRFGRLRLRESGFSRPYILFSWTEFDRAADRKSENRFMVLPTMLNSHGEFVWIAGFAKGSRFPGSSALLHKTGPREVLIQLWDQQSGVRILDTKTGKILRELEPQIAGKKVFFNHGFHYLPEEKSVVTLVRDCQPLSRWSDPSPVFQGIAGFFRRFYLPERTYSSSYITKFNLFTGESKKIWNARSDFSMTSHPSLAVYLMSDRFLDARSPEVYSHLLSKPYMRKEAYGQECLVDWLHENSVRHYPGKGYLVSLRNINKVVLVSEDGKLRWSLGEGPNNTYSLPYNDTGFAQQHDAHLLADDRVILFSNNAPYRGSAETHRYSEIQKIQLLNNGRAAIEWKYTIPMHRSPLRGSVDVVENGNVFAYSSGSQLAPLHFLEVAPQTNALVGSILLWVGNTEYRSIEARPITSILDERYIGGKKIRANAGAQEPPPPAPPPSSEGY